MDGVESSRASEEPCHEASSVSAIVRRRRNRTGRPNRAAGHRLQREHLLPACGPTAIRQVMHGRSAHRAIRPVPAPRSATPTPQRARSGSASPAAGQCARPSVAPAPATRPRPVSAPPGTPALRTPLSRTRHRRRSCRERTPTVARRCASVRGAASSPRCLPACRAMASWPEVTPPIDPAVRAPRAACASPAACPMPDPDALSISRSCASGARLTYRQLPNVIALQFLAC